MKNIFFRPYQTYTCFAWYSFMGVYSFASFGCRHNLHRAKEKEKQLW